MQNAEHGIDSGGIVSGGFGAANFGERIDQGFVPIDIAIGEVRVKILHRDPKLSNGYQTVGLGR